jgi:hypothetical protein
MKRTTLLLGVLVVLLVAFVVAFLGPLATPVESEYGYSVTLATNATLSNVTLYLPYPASDEGSPFDAAFEGTAGNASVPEGWRVAPVETEHGRMLRVTASEVSTRLRSDGRRYETHTLRADVPAGHDIDTVDPVGSEPLLRPADGFETVPCPNRAFPSRATCRIYGTRLYAQYDAPEDADADVDVVVVFGGYDDLGGGRGRWYSERVIARLEGTRDGWVEVPGDLQAGAGSFP